MNTLPAIILDSKFQVPIMRHRRGQAEGSKSSKNRGSGKPQSVQELFKEVIRNQQVIRREMEKIFEVLAIRLGQKYQEFACDMIKSYLDFVANHACSCWRQRACNTPSMSPKNRQSPEANYDFLNGVDLELFPNLNDITLLPDKQGQARLAVDLPHIKFEPICDNDLVKFTSYLF